MKIKNEVLFNEKFTAAMQRVTSIMWDREVDDALYVLLLEVSEIQKALNHHLRNYRDAAGLDEVGGDDPQAADAFRRNWEPLMAEESDISLEKKLTLRLNGRRMLSAMERYQLKDLCTFVFEA